MSTYNINFSDPLRAGFQIAPGGFNGPGSSSPESGLRLYGRGALEWGEAVDENMLRMVENWCGATPPPFALAGQLWFQTKFFWLHTATNWYVMDPDVPGTWTNITGSVSGGVVGTNTTPPLVVGTYWYTAGAPVGNDAFGAPLEPTTLYVYDVYTSPGAQVGWLKRTNTINALAPVNGVDYPERNLLVWDEFLGNWVSPPVAFVAPNASPPPDPSIGAFWWDTTFDRLNVWDGTAWVGIILASGTVPMVGQLTLPLAPVAATDAVNKAYADALAAPAFLNATYLRLDGTNTPTAALTMGGFNLMNLPAQVYPLANSNNAASITYVNGLGAAVGTPTSGSVGFATVFNTGGPYTAPGARQGDLVIDGSHRVWIKTTVGFILTGPTNFNVTDGSDANWRQLFPALYS